MTKKPRARSEKGLCLWLVFHLGARPSGLPLPRWWPSNYRCEHLTQMVTVARYAKLAS